MGFDPAVNRVWNPNAESECEELNEAGRLRPNMCCQLDAHCKAILNSLESFTVEHLRTGVAERTVGENIISELENIRTSENRKLKRRLLRVVGNRDRFIDRFPFEVAGGERGSMSPVLRTLIGEGNLVSFGRCARHVDEVYEAIRSAAASSNNDLRAENYRNHMDMDGIIEAVGTELETLKAIHEDMHGGADVQNDGQMI